MSAKSSKKKKSGRPKRALIVTYGDIAKFTGKTEAYIRELEADGRFDIDDARSVCFFVMGYYFLEEAKKKK